MPTNIGCLRVRALDLFVEKNLFNSSMTEVDEDCWEELLHGGVLEALDDYKRVVKELLDNTFYEVVDSYYHNRPLLRWDGNPLPRSILKHDHAAAFYQLNCPMYNQIWTERQSYSDFREPLQHVNGLISRISESSMFRNFTDAWNNVLGVLDGDFYCTAITLEVAMALLRSLKCEQSTMEEMNSRGHAFLCLSCIRTEKKGRFKRLCWRDLVQCSSLTISSILLIVSSGVALLQYRQTWTRT